ncbi:MAG TPA: DUF488 domain-containing protein [Solirubrobacteraceae bacterium]|nr:DUF488 domain-containing protein [Solirubrobacteraceae bacterium]
MQTIATIGVYEFDAASFLRALDDAGVTKVLDIRQRRGVRGTEYAWANAQRLQRLLENARIAYEHHPELAPDTEMRQLQYSEDARQGVGKRSRARLSEQYIRQYTGEVLDLVPLEPIVRQLPVHGIGALLCVEATAQACHRSLVAQRLSERFGFEILNLEPVEPAAFDLNPRARRPD